MNHPIIPLASSQINHDTISIDLVEPDSMPPMVRVVWAAAGKPHRSESVPRCRGHHRPAIRPGAHCAREPEGARPVTGPELLVSGGGQAALTLKRFKGRLRKHLRNA